LVAPVVTKLNLDVEPEAIDVGLAVKDVIFTVGVVFASIAEYTINEIQNKTETNIFLIMSNSFVDILLLAHQKNLKT
jgi:hypothetical protein